jgi:hypothetical protein
MTASPEGCGKTTHPPECLCDVIVKKATEVRVTIPYGMTNGEAIAHFGKWDGSLLHWFELSDIAWDAIKAVRASRVDSYEEQQQDGKFKRSLPPDVYAYLVRGIKDNKQPTPLRQEIIDIFGYTINKSYVTKLRQRLQARGEI